MSTYDVYLSTPAETVVRAVEAEDPDEAIELAYDQAPVVLCHQCAAKVDMAGEWEPTAVFDSSGDVVWEGGR